MLFVIAGSRRALKLQSEDVDRLESQSKKNIDDMDEELVEGMDRLGIKSISLTDDEKQLVLVICPYCGHKNE